jgi:hypothetical protein
MMSRDLGQQHRHPRRDRPPRAPAPRPRYELARSIVLERGTSTRRYRARDRGRRHHGGDPRDLAECTFAGLVGTLDNLAGRVELDAFLTPRA